MEVKSNDVKKIREVVKQFNKSEDKDRYILTKKGKIIKIQSNLHNNQFTFIFCKKLFDICNKNELEVSFYNNCIEIRKGEYNS